MRASALRSMSKGCLPPTTEQIITGVLLMSFWEITGIVALTTLAASYGWGMRGCMIGGEKGAMLPGAYIGLLFARFSGSAIIRENFWIFAAAGALGMFFGGTETYGQTLGFIVNKKPPVNYAKGMQGVILKGALWFGVFGAFLGMSLTAMTGEIYKPSDIIVLCALIIPLRLLGILIFNSPYKPKDKKFPRLYFSVDRREEWGGNLLLLAALVILMSIRRDSYSLLLCAVGAVSGAVGWAVGINLFYITKHPLKNGRFIFGSLQKKGYIDNWKIMEWTLGAFGGFGLSLAFCLNFDALKKITGTIEKNGGLWNPLGGANFMLSWIAATLILLTVLQHFFYNKATVKFKNKLKYERAGKAFEWLEQPFYCYLPLMLILLGGVNMAQIISFFAMFWVIAEKSYFERFAALKFRLFWFVVLVGGSAAVFINELFLHNSYGIWQTWLLYCIGYELLELCWTWRPDAFALAKKKTEAGGKLLRAFGSVTVVHGVFILQIAGLITAGYFVFR